MIDDGALEVLAFARQVGHAIRGVGDDFGRRRALEALGIDRLLEVLVEGGRDEEIEIGDLGELAQRIGRREVDLAKDAAHARVRVLAPAARREEPADDVVQRIRIGKLRRIDVELDRELFGHPVVEKARARRGVDLEELGADDGDDAAFLDEVEEVIPRVLVETRNRRLQGNYIAHFLTPSL